LLATAHCDKRPEMVEFSMVVLVVTTKNIKHY